MNNEIRKTMKLQTNIIIPHSEREIAHSDNVLFLGSCFSQHIAQKMYAAGFCVSSNPFGVLYNPLSILKCVQLLSGIGDFDDSDLVESDRLWYSLLHHGSFCAESKDEMMSQVITTIESGREQLAKSSVVIITLGTAWIYERQGRVVGNCHKLPADQFVRRRLSLTETTDALNQLLFLLKDKTVIFTVSPIRHVKDGLHENQLSKSTLLLAIEAVKNNAMYFPSYELMIDELRDYRFYADDLLHPSPMAIQIIWERFSDTFFSEQTIQQAHEVEALYDALHHRPLHTNTATYSKFKQTTLNKLQTLKKRYSWLDFSSDLLI